MFELCLINFIMFKLCLINDEYFINI